MSALSGLGRVGIKGLERSAQRSFATESNAAKLIRTKTTKKREVVSPLLKKTTNDFGVGLGGAQFDPKSVKFAQGVGQAGPGYGPLVMGATVGGIAFAAYNIRENVVHLHHYSRTLSKRENWEASGESIQAQARALILEQQNQK